MTLGDARRWTAAFWLAVVVALAWQPGPASAQEPVATVVGQTGPATVMRGGTPVLLRPGVRVHLDDEIYTYAGARVKLRFNDGAEVAIGARSRVLVRRYAGSAGGSASERLLELLGGILRVVFGGTGGFDVRATTAVASTRSTEWVVEAKPDTTAVFVVDGRVAVSAREAAGRVELTAGEGTDVAAGTAPTPPKRWGEKRVRDVLARTDVPELR